MSITIDDIKFQQDKVAAMIAQFEAQAPRIFNLAAARIELQAGEHYAGVIIDEAGTPTHHLVLLPGQETGIAWDDAAKWAERVGGHLPTRSEQALLHANLKAQFDPNWYWSGEQYAAYPSYAWGQGFLYGNQDANHKSYEGRARAVRRVAI